MLRPGGKLIVDDKNVKNAMLEHVPAYLSFHFNEEELWSVFCLYASGELCSRYFSAATLMEVLQLAGQCDIL